MYHHPVYIKYIHRVSTIKPRKKSRARKSILDGYSDENLLTPGTKMQRKNGKSSLPPHLPKNIAFFSFLFFSIENVRLSIIQLVISLYRFFFSFLFYAFRMENYKFRTHKTRGQIVKALSSPSPPPPNLKRKYKGNRLKKEKEKKESRRVSSLSRDESVCRYRSQRLGK